MTKRNGNTAAPVIRDSAGLRDALFDEIDALRQGNSNPTRANAVAKLAATVVDSVRMEVEVRKAAEAMASESVAIEKLPQPLKLGNTMKVA